MTTTVWLSWATPVLALATAALSLGQLEHIVSPVLVLIGAVLTAIVGFVVVWQQRPKPEPEPAKPVQPVTKK